VLALVHDVLITLGFFALTQIEFDLAVLAAVLAVIGYSLNDTIVVYDRIRENFRVLRKESTEFVMNNAVNKTLSRTIVTSMTTLLVLIALFVLGGAALNNFAIALIVGVDRGNLLVHLHRRRRRADARRRSQGPAAGEEGGC
jgi:preprotein translocase subunit SecF